MVAEAWTLGGDEWGQTILAQANEAHQRVLQAQMIEKAGEYASRCAVWWKEMEAVKKEMAEIQRKVAFKELTGEYTSLNSVLKEDRVNGVGALPTPTKSKKKNKKQASAVRLTCILGVINRVS